ncbi:MAG: 30S ribosomal protein S16 [Gammaproteobacteria bacterium]|jgi:small subunit ribosomal protein S16|nr:30S ribosomal protein S16 [Gammaproteobacteria bacterium]|tara:strand:+ start:367 stop:651 length:285 start_codon:yes stop_codon:yes gene_type:complete
MVIVRLSRGGSKNRPFYHFTVADHKRARDSRFIERLGFYNPGARGGEESIRLDLARIDYWISVGAQLSDRVASLVKEYRKSTSEMSSEEEGAAA